MEKELESDFSELTLDVKAPQPEEKQCDLKCPANIVFICIGTPTSR